MAKLALTWTSAGPASAVRISALSAMLCGGWAGLSPAFAQGSDQFGTIQDRYRPEFSSRPVTVGGLEISPRIQVDTEVIDNVFGSEVTDRNDVTISLRPVVTVRDRRSDRQLSLNAGATFETYLNNSFSDRVLINANGRARFGLNSRTRPFLGFSFRQNDTRISEFVDLSTTAQPVQLTSLTGNGGIEQEFGVITASVEGQYNSTRFNGEVISDAEDANTVLNDFDLLGAQVELAYSVNPSNRIYIQAAINDREYFADSELTAGATDAIVDRTSNGYSIRAGTRLSLNEILLLDASVGYLEQNFDSASFNSVSSLSFDASLFYSPTRLTQIRLSANRSIDDSVNPFFNGFLRTEFAVGIEHELLRNLIISSEGRYRIVASNDATDTSQSNAEEFQVSGGLRFLVDDRWSIRARASYFQRDSIFGGLQLRGRIGLAYSF